MTLDQIKNLSDRERSEFMNITCHNFQQGQSLKDYTESIKDYIYIWRHIEEGRKTYSLDRVKETVAISAPVIKKYYEELAPIDEAAVDVDYACG